MNLLYKVNMCRDIRVFIGGSSEGLKYAEKLCSFINKHEGIKCTIWNKTFDYNVSFLDSLKQSSLLNDFGIFIASRDDIAKIRKEDEIVPRDNVIFEYGMFLGEMKNNRTYLVQEDGCKLPTDLLGYTTPQFNASYLDNDWNDLAYNLTCDIKKQAKNSVIQSLPSTSLAIGYFYSFLSKLAQSLGECEGSVLNKSKLEHGDVKVDVLIPNELSDDINATAFMYYKKNKYKSDEIGNPNRAFPIRFYQKIDTNELSIFDVPTTLNSLRHSINLLIPSSDIGKNDDKLFIERKELENFKKTLEHLVSTNPFAKDLVSVKWMK